MQHSSLASFGCHATIIAASLSLCLTSKADTQTTNRYYPVDKTLMEYLISKDGISYYPFIIIDETDKMAAKMRLDNPANYLDPVAVSLQNGYAESDDETIQLTLTHIDASKNEGFEFKIDSKSKTKTLGTISDRFYFNGTNAKETFTFIFDDADNLKLQIRSASYKNGKFFSIVYTGHEQKEGFKLMTDDTKGLSIYQLDNLRFTFDESVNGSDKENVVLTISPNKEYIGYNTAIKYILNNGEPISIYDLLSSEHSKNIIWADYKKGNDEITLPNYNPEATTLWALPVSSDLNIPVSNVFSASYADKDISTAISAPNVDPSYTDEPQYYNLHGVRVTQPSTPGIYICRQGNSTTKVLVK